ncbi:MAG: hypothetical protein PHP95_07510 [Desulfuromonadaceae bacterium]|nr:hypothetical protein [Desulfuromonadaceae bacterium]MDD2848286.1 hypothetical protein [Desulfuromonadaceae bacterium]MDD4129318.1 hypothetical protein [Desulfuromonadaceae bacterium]
MNSNIVIIALLQFTLLCTPLVLQAAALDQDEDPDQRWVCKELCRVSNKQKNSLQVKSQRMIPPLDLIQNSAQLQQGELLQELLAPEVVSHVSMQQGGNEVGAGKYRHDTARQEDRLLKEFTAATSLP